MRRGTRDHRTGDRWILRGRPSERRLARPPIVPKAKRSLVEDRGSIASSDHDIASVCSIESILVERMARLRDAVYRHPYSRGCRHEASKSAFS
jgi:hypothetical protein